MIHIILASNVNFYNYLLSKGYNAIDGLSISESISMNDVIMHPEIPRQYDKLSMNPNIIWIEINKYPEIPWNFNNIAHNNMVSPLKRKYWQSVFDKILKEINYINSI